MVAIACFHCSLLPHFQSVHPRVPSGCVFSYSKVELHPPHHIVFVSSSIKPERKAASLKRCEKDSEGNHESQKAN